MSGPLVLVRTAAGLFTAGTLAVGAFAAVSVPVPDGAGVAATASHLMRASVATLEHRLLPSEQALDGARTLLDLDPHLRGAGRDAASTLVAEGDDRDRTRALRAAEASGRALPPGALLAAVRTGAAPVVTAAIAVAELSAPGDRRVVHAAVVERALTDASVLARAATLVAGDPSLLTADDAVGLAGQVASSGDPELLAEVLQGIAHQDARTRALVADRLVDARSHWADVRHVAGAAVMVARTPRALNLLGVVTDDLELRRALFAEASRLAPGDPIIGGNWALTEKIIATSSCQPVPSGVDDLLDLAIEHAADPGPFEAARRLAPPPRCNQPHCRK